MFSVLKISQHTWNSLGHIDGPQRESGSTGIKGHVSLKLFFFHWNIAVIFISDILVTETFQSFVSQLY